MMFDGVGSKNEDGLGGGGDVKVADGSDEEESKHDDCWQFFRRGAFLNFLVQYCER